MNHEEEVYCACWQGYFSEFNSETMLRYYFSPFINMLRIKNSSVFCLLQWQGPQRQDHKGRTTDSSVNCQINQLVLGQCVNKFIHLHQKLLQTLSLQCQMLWKWISLCHNTCSCSSSWLSRMEPTSSNLWIKRRQGQGSRSRTACNLIATLLHGCIYWLWQQ